MDPSGSRVAIRGATSDDADDLERIEAVSFDGDRLSRRSLRHHLVSPTCDVLVAELVGSELGRRIVGYAMVFYRSTTSIARLYSIATTPEARGHGVGDRLMEGVERAARKRSCTAMRLEVRTDNAGAIRLYERRGYTRFGRHENYYEDGAPALRFEKPLTRNATRKAA